MGTGAQVVKSMLNEISYDGSTQIIGASFKR
jgi:hypothetical protein